jgi:hypothetical protein
VETTAERSHLSFRWHTDPESTRRIIDGLIVFFIGTGILLWYLSSSTRPGDPAQLLQLLDVAADARIEELVQQRWRDSSRSGFWHVYSAAFQRVASSGAQATDRLADQVFTLFFAVRPDHPIDQRHTALGFFLNQIQGLPGTPQAYVAITRHLDRVFREWRSPALETEWRQWGKTVAFQYASGAAAVEDLLQAPGGRDFLALRPDLEALLRQQPAPMESEPPLQIVVNATFSNGEGFHSVGGNQPPAEASSSVNSLFRSAQP